MRYAFLLLVLLFATFQNAVAKKTWEKEPQSWSEKDCSRILEKSPWCREVYKPAGMGSNTHYLLRVQCLSPVLLCAEAREEQLAKGEDPGYLKDQFENKMKDEELDEDEFLVFRVYPMKGDGLRGQNLHPLYSGDPFFEQLKDNIVLIKGSDKEDALRPVEFKPINNNIDEGFKVYFEKKSFAESQPNTLILLIDTKAGEFKAKFDTNTWSPSEIKL